MKKKKKSKFELNGLLGKFFTIEGNVATLKLVYDTFAELVNLNFGDERIEKLNDKLFSDIKEAVDILPKAYKLNVEVVIKDFGDYSREECESIIVQNVKLSLYLALKSTGSHRWGGLALMGVGAAVLVVSYLLQSAKYDILFDVVNISGTLFVWEGANMAFLQRNLDLKQTKRMARVLQNIVVVQQN